MRYFRTECISVDGPEFSESEFGQIGAWVYLMNYCAAQENGGCIQGAKGRKDAFFDRSLKVSRTILEQESQLWTWTGEDLLVRFYSLEAEQSYQEKRELGKRGGKKKAENLAHAKAHALATKPNPTQSHETKKDLTQKDSTQSPPDEPASPEETHSFLKAIKEVGGKGLFQDMGVGSGSAVTLDDLFRKIETLKVGPQSRLKAQDMARKLWRDTEEGKHLGGKPVKDLRAVLMTRLQAEGVIKKKRR